MSSHPETTHTAIEGGESMWGMLFLLLGLGFGLGAYYTHGMFLYYTGFTFISFGLILLVVVMIRELVEKNDSKVFSFLIVLGLSLLYFVLRLQVHRFDFGVGDAADYYVAGVCSVTYGQDIGFFLPLTASVSGLGFSIFGSAYAPFMHVVVYFATIPLGYLIARALRLHRTLALFMTLLMVINPLSIWFSKSSFSEPIWQLLLLCFVWLFYYIVQRSSVRPLEIILLYLILALAPFLRGEGVIYYALMLLLVLYHLWQHSNLKTALILVGGLFVLALSIHLTLGIREHYLIGWQFSRIIPGVTPVILMSILYGVAVSSALLIYWVGSAKTCFHKVPFAMAITILTLLFKVGVAYVYAKKREPSFFDYLCLHEYEFAVGNFGIPLTLLIIAGLFLLYIRAFKGEALALVLVTIYAIFHLPFVMQGVTFYDPHELFLYWNRYYFSVLMMVHLFALALSVGFIFHLLNKVVSKKQYSLWLVWAIMLGIMLSSLNLNVAKIVVQESYLQNSDKVFTWLKKYVGRGDISVLYDNSIRYERHNGLYDTKVFVSRMLNVRKVYVKKWKKVHTKQFNAHLKLDNDFLFTNYLVSFSTKKNRVHDKRLKVIAKKVFDISWREHYRARPRSKDECSGDVSNSYMNQLQMHVTIYRILK
jgi:hypothetical protein